MKLAVSNIAWNTVLDDAMYSYLNSLGFEGLEIAPTRLFPVNPYDRITEAREYAHSLYEKYGLSICSVQSIWYGRSASLFESDDQMHFYLDYSEKAFEFAAACGCRNVVFGNPRQRSLFAPGHIDRAYVFFEALARMAAGCDVVVALEPNPEIYGTNFLTRTDEAAAFVREIASPNLKINLDIGTCLFYHETIDSISRFFPLINHIHLSEPGLGVIAEHDFHGIICEMLKKKKYGKWLSLEMVKPDSHQDLLQAIEYMKKVFHEQYS